jgi:hypothetical protein
MESFIIEPAKPTETIFKIGPDFIVDIPEPFQPKSRRVTPTDDDYAKWEQYAADNPELVYDCWIKQVSAKDKWKSNKEQVRKEMQEKAFTKYKEVLYNGFIYSKDTFNFGVRCDEESQRYATGFLALSVKAPDAPINWWGIDNMWHELTSTEFFQLFVAISLFVEKAFTEYQLVKRTIEGDDYDIINDAFTAYCG